MGSLVETVVRTSIAKGVEGIAAFNRMRRPRRTTPHPFLTGIHEPMTEELTLTDLQVIGTVPAALDGEYLRIGPNPVTVDPDSYHWFIGDGMVHGVRLENGRALWYRNRWIRSKSVAAALGEAPAPGPRHGGFDTVNTNVVPIGGRIRALVEAGSYPVELAATLEDQAYNAFDDTLAGSFTAHPHLDPLTGEHHAICYEAKDPAHIRHVVIDPQGKVVREQSIAVEHGPMIHDSALTRRFAIILDMPVTFSVRTLMRAEGLPYRWNPEHKARVGLMPRDGGEADIIWCPMDPAYVFHVANAYDAPDGTVVMDVCAYDTMFDGEPGGPDATSCGLERWTIDPVAKSVARHTLDRFPQEFPRIDERYFGQRHRHAFAVAAPRQGEERSSFASALYAHDLEAGTRQVHDFKPGEHPGEFVFVPATPDSPEGEGWLLGLVIDEPNQTTDLLVLDATRLAEPAVARIRIPHRVPPGFHGNWIPAGAAR